MKVQHSVEWQRNTLANRDDEIIVSFHSVGVTTSFDSIALMRGIGALAVAFHQTAKAVELLTSNEESK